MVVQGNGQLAQDYVYRDLASKTVEDNVAGEVVLEVDKYRVQVIMKRGIVSNWGKNGRNTAKALGLSVVV